MSRTAATVFEEIPQGNYIEQVISCEGLFVVLYNFKPFQLRHFKPMIGIKNYGRTAFVNSAHAYRLAERLNKETNTLSFTVENLIGE